MPKPKMQTEVIAALREQNLALLEEIDVVRGKLLKAELENNAIVSMYRALAVLSRAVPDSIAGRRTLARAVELLGMGHLKSPTPLLRLLSPRRRRRVYRKRI